MSKATTTINALCIVPSKHRKKPRHLLPILTSRSSSLLSSRNKHHMIATPTPYEVPEWCQGILTNEPKGGRLRLGNLPTPVYQMSHPLHRNTDGGYTHDTSHNEQTHPPPTSSSLSLCDKLWNHVNENNIVMYIKRDDMSGGIELGGNKIRKLEFLLADAITQQYHDVITIGGEQSNHCRATAAACRMIGLQPHLILRRSSNKKQQQQQASSSLNDVGYVGNLLIDRMIGSTIYTCTIGEYGRTGSKALLQRVSDYLVNVQEKSKPPYLIPVGGSNGLGTWGYIQGIEELIQQWPSSSSLDHIILPCGSGGTAAGICLGISLAFYYYSQRHHPYAIFHNKTKPPYIHAIGVCDDAEYFYQHIIAIAQEMGFANNNNIPNDQTIDDFIRHHIIIHQGKGLGYSISTTEELSFIQQFAIQTGIVLDPVYTGKAFYTFVKDILLLSPTTNLVQPHDTILFWHTGGTLGLYDKVEQFDHTFLQSHSHSPCYQLDVYRKEKGDNVIPV